MRKQFVVFGLLALASSHAAIAGGSDASDITGSIAPLSVSMTIDTEPSAKQDMLSPGDFLAGLQEEARALTEIAKASAAAAAAALADNDPNYFTLETRAGRDALALSQTEATLSEIVPTGGR